MDLQLPKTFSTWQYVFKKKKKKHDKIVLPANCELKKIKVLISKTLFDSNISHHEFHLRKNLLKEYDEMKVEIQNLKT